MNVNRFAWLIVSAVCVSPAVAGEDRATARDRAALQGAWTVVEAEREGEPLDRIRGNSLVVEGDRFTIRTKTSELKGTFTLDPGIAPSEMNLEHKGGTVAGQTWLAIYAINGDELKLCYTNPDLKARRPRDFVTSPGSGMLSVTLKRGAP